MFKIFSNKDKFVELLLRITQKKIIKFFFQILESILFLYYKRKFKKKISSKFFVYFQLFCNTKISALYRRRKHEILSEKLDSTAEIDKKVSEISNKSYVKLFNLETSEVKSTIDYFYKQKIYTSHVPKDLAHKNELISVDEFLKTNSLNYGSFDIGTSLNSAAINKVCSKNEIWEVARKYLNTNNVKIYSINTMLTKKSPKKNHVVNLHVDFDSASMLTFFIYWTDVEKNNGATRVLPGSHLYLHDRKLAGYIYEPLTKYLDDKSGSVFALDTWALHSGNPNIIKPRLVTWIRFSSMPAQTYYLNRNYLYKKDLNKINNDKKI